MRLVFFAASGVVRFENRDVALGRPLAESLGSAPVAFMRGHGSVAVADSLALAVYVPPKPKERGARAARPAPR